MFDGNGVSFSTDTEVVLSSESNQASQFGVVLTKNAYNGADVDFQVDYVQTDYASLQSAYESQLVIFFVPEGTLPATLLQTDNNFGEFEAATVGYLRSKVFTTMDHTWFYCGTGEVSQGTSTSTKYLELSLRIRRLNNTIYAYYKAPGSDTWVDIKLPMAIPQSLHGVPLQFGFRVKKEYKTHHNFSVHAKKLA